MSPDPWLYGLVRSGTRTRKAKAVGSHERTTLLYYGYPVAGVLVVVSILFFGSHHRAINAGIVLVAIPVLLEGVALLVNWRGGADEFTARLHAFPRSLFRTLPGRLIRFGLGIGMAALGVVLMYDGIQYM
jgi:hypothetical protein